MIENSSTCSIRNSSCDMVQTSTNSIRLHQVIAHLTGVGADHHPLFCSAMEPTVNWDNSVESKDHHLTTMMPS
ncbi:hypothetical protein BDR04DRAFT_242800 [Suillus decipiens]|nr:hypothetical protein BDR04DRAFT_242800 [Suillus decipiens]